MIELNGKTYLNANNVVYINKINNQWYAVTTDGNKVAITEAIATELQSYSPGTITKQQVVDALTYLPVKSVNNTSPDENGDVTISVGTEVVANPTLAGTEDDLTALQVGDTKYKVPQGGGEKLYKHLVSFRRSYQNQTFYAIVINNYPNAYTSATDYLFFKEFYRIIDLKSVDTSVTPAEYSTYLITGFTTEHPYQLTGTMITLTNTPTISASTGIILNSTYSYTIISDNVTELTTNG